MHGRLMASSEDNLPTEMNGLIGIPCVLMRGGTSRGPFFLREDLPADDEAMKAAAIADEKVAARLEGKTVVKTIVVKGKMVNLVVK